MKRRIRKTGEVIDVIAYHQLFPGERHSSDTVSYIDSKGNEHQTETMNLDWDTEEIDTEEIEKDLNIDKRFELLKVIMPYFCALFNKIHNLKDYNINEYRKICQTNFKDDFYILFNIVKNCGNSFINFNSTSDDDSNIDESENKESTDPAEEAESKELNEIFHKMKNNEYVPVERILKAVYFYEPHNKQYSENNDKVKDKHEKDKHEKDKHEKDKHEKDKHEKNAIYNVLNEILESITSNSYVCLKIFKDETTMKKFMHNFAPDEIVLCLSTNTLYKYNDNYGEMQTIAG